MLRASVSLSRKVSHDLTSSGYVVTLAGEVPHPPDDAEAVLEKVSELFHLAEEALAVEIERDRRRHPDPGDAPTRLPPSATTSRQPEPLPINRPAASNGPTASADVATPKQLQFLQNLAKRKGLARDGLDAVIGQLLGSAKRTAELTKREAGRVIDHLTKLQPEESR